MYNPFKHNLGRAARIQIIPANPLKNQPRKVIKHQKISAVEQKFQRLRKYIYDKYGVFTFAKAANIINNKQDYITFRKDALKFAGLR